ncbi:MAG: nucleoside hydrolase, partial [Actinomycetota bacterium]
MSVFVDEAQLNVRGGDGGSGCVSFRREGPVVHGGPNGGDGGNGGSVWLEADRNVASLLAFRDHPHRRGQDGVSGMGKDLHGRRGEELIVKVPEGTVVKDLYTGDTLCDLDSEGCRVVLKQKMWVDTDTASDDAVALILAVKSKTTEVLGISIVAGNVPIESGVQAALYTLEMCCAQVPVHVGASRPLVRTFSSAQNVHGTDGMGDIGLKLAGRTPASHDAIRKMLETFGSMPGQIDLVTLGPLTNIALALAI